MAQTNPANPTAPSKKRKAPPQNNTAQQHKKQKTTSHHRARQRDARTLSTQTAPSGSLDVDKFVAAREFEIHALEQGMQRSKKALNRRAFQQVPKELRRRTASHDVRRVPKRLRGRAGREMVEDNTPTGKEREREKGRKGKGKMRLRVETVKKLRALGARKREDRVKGDGDGDGKVTVVDPAATDGLAARPDTTEKTVVKTRCPRTKKAASLAKPPVPKAKFRKRQAHKSWLPTHGFHAKRAHMTPPSAPLWRFAVPLTPTQKSYRPTHRASHERGAVAWDTSYMATIGLEGQQRSVEGVLKALGVEVGVKGEKWRRGTRVLETFVLEREEPHELIAPVTVVWCVADGAGTVEDRKVKRKCWLRVHPSAFFQLWEEVVRLGKVAKPSVSVEDLRFEIGSIEITGPGSTEALLGALWPSRRPDDSTEEETPSVEKTWTGLAGVTNPSMLPAGALLGFNIQDPRLHHPPMTISLPKSQEDQNKLLELLATWPMNMTQQPPHLFNSSSRSQGSKLPSQKSINRRKSLAPPGSYPPPSSTDPSIPVLLYTTNTPSPTTKHTSTTPSSSSWTLLAPWKTIQPLWYSIIYYPLSTGQQPRFGGLKEMQQLAFEGGRAWFPADFPGTKAGWEWECKERGRRWEEWRRRPSGKRVVFERVDLGEGKKGEVGVGWACDWERLVGGVEAEDSVVGGVVEGEENNDESAEETNNKPVRNNGGEQTEKTSDVSVEEKSKEKADLTHDRKPEKKNDKSQNKVESETPPPLKPSNLTHLTSAQALALLKPSSNPIPDLKGKITTIRLTLLTRGVPQTCARIYRLPAASAQPELRAAWLTLLPITKHAKNNSKKHALPKPRFKNEAPHTVQQRLARSLLEPPRAGDDNYPTCPGEEDLIGFVTTGNFNLAEGQGTGVGCLLVQKVVEDANEGKTGEGRLCVIRNAGTTVGRLGRWDFV
ncbi:Ribonucleases P/MRP protein subunit pop1 [Vermiconidia calcicola]|uniref:Ribonucleases P/MRP protein subunit pop1 n=1 Tax=Vermiconidia calcicola TaxID=1690605 RepID=A0ACC3NBN7_9PEZI|nr:Ribonucleases P/MRP protein subunit pop1 [Vermiconidia calcicola]